VIDEYRCLSLTYGNHLVRCSLFYKEYGSRPNIVLNIPSWFSSPEEIVSPGRKRMSSVAFASIRDKEGLIIIQGLPRRGEPTT